MLFFLLSFSSNPISWIKNYIYFSFDMLGHHKSDDLCSQKFLNSGLTSFVWYSYCLATEICIITMID